MNALMGKRPLRNSLNQCKNKISIKQGLDVKKIKNNKGLIEVITKNITIKTKYLIDSRNKISKEQYESPPSLQQAFVGNEIISKNEQFDPEVIKLMNFSNNKKEVEFTYTLPFSKKSALVETTFFSKRPSYW